MLLAQDTLDIRVQAGAANYFAHPGALARIAEFYPPERAQRVFWLSGETALQAAQAYLPPFFKEARVHCHVAKVHCTQSTVSQLAKKAALSDVVIGMGGGSVLDTAKALAHRLHKPFVAIPTIAATCAAWTPLAVWYDDTGKALGYEVFPAASQLVLVEPRLIFAAPEEFLRAGIGDTLAKWYEARVLCAVEPHLPFGARLGLQAASFIRDVLLNEGPRALQALAENSWHDSVGQVIDAVIAGGGLVGGLGERFTRLSGAHAIHNGLTVLPETAAVLHGAKVAYGILVQLALEGRTDELKALSHAWRALQLPRCLADLGVDATQQDRVDAFIAHSIVPHESIHLLPTKVDDARLHTAVRQVEDLAKEGT